jgi:hypothetical protein
MPCVTPVQISVAGNGLAGRGELSPCPRNDSTLRFNSKFGAAASAGAGNEKGPERLCRLSGPVLVGRECDCRFVDKPTIALEPRSGGTGSGLKVFAMTRFLQANRLPLRLKTLPRAISE